MSLLLQLRRRLGLRHKLSYLKWCFGRAGEALRYTAVEPNPDLRFHFVSASRNAGATALKCLQSVYDQDWPRDRVRHVYIDDASTDGTHEKVLEWLEQHPDHNVDYIHPDERRGGTANNVAGFDKAPPRSIVVELNGDDWLPDPGVVRFLAKVYADDDVWKTYNTSRIMGEHMPWLRRIADRVVRSNAYRSEPWTSSHLHTFRRELYDHVGHDTFIDPETGEYWESADDQALYLAMLELAAERAVHLYRVTCIYNFHEASEHNVDRDGQRSRKDRIRAQAPRQRLDGL